MKEQLFSVVLSIRDGDVGGGGGAVLNQYLGIGEPLTLFRKQKLLKYIPCLGQDPQFYYPVYN